MPHETAFVSPLESMFNPSMQIHQKANRKAREKKILGSDLDERG